MSVTNCHFPVPLDCRKEKGKRKRHQLHFTVSRQLPTRTIPHRVGIGPDQGHRKVLRRQSIGGASDCLRTMTCPSNALFAQNLPTPLVLMSGFTVVCSCPDSELSLLESCPRDGGPGGQQFGFIFYPVGICPRTTFHTCTDLYVLADKDSIYTKSVRA